VELLIVVFVLGVIAVIVYPNVMSMRDRSNYALCEANLRMIEAAKASYVADHMGLTPQFLDFSSSDPQQRADAENEKLVLLSYFPEGLKKRAGDVDYGVFVCPRDPNHGEYVNVYSFYDKVYCPYCKAHPPR
jgi:competence protein ComGC